MVKLTIREYDHRGRAFALFVDPYVVVALEPVTETRAGFLEIVGTRLHLNTGLQLVVSGPPDYIHDTLWPKGVGS